MDINKQMKLESQGPIAKRKLETKEEVFGVLVMSRKSANEETGRKRAIKKAKLKKKDKDEIKYIYEKMAALQLLMIEYVQKEYPILAGETMWMFMNSNTGYSKIYIKDMNKLERFPVLDCAVWQVRYVLEEISNREEGNTLNDWKQKAFSFAEEIYDVNPPKTILELEEFMFEYTSKFIFKYFIQEDLDDWLDRLDIVLSDMKE